MKEKFKLLYALMVIQFLFCSCEKQKEQDQPDYYEYPLEYKWEKDYPEYFHHALYYEIKHNANALKPEFMLNILLKAPDLANLIQLNRTYIGKQVLKVNEKKAGSDISYVFYKLLENNVENDSFVKFVQIEYPVTVDSRKKEMILAIEPFDSTKKSNCAYIEWSSMPANEFLKIEFIDQRFSYMWGINKTTDTLTTNLSYDFIKLLFPEFQGKYRFKKYKEIIVDYKFQSDDTLFFKNIKYIE